MVNKRNSGGSSKTMITEFKSSPEFEYPTSSFVLERNQGMTNNEDDFDNMLSPNVPSTLTPPLVPLAKKRKSLPSVTVGSTASVSALSSSSASKKNRPHPNSIAIAAPSSAVLDASSAKSNGSIRGGKGKAMDRAIEIAKPTQSSPAGEKRDKKRSPVHADDNVRSQRATARRDEFADRRSGARNRVVASLSTSTSSWAPFPPFDDTDQPVDLQNDKHDVANFLASLPLPLSHLLPTFASLGCTSASDLRALTLDTVVGRRCREAILDAVTQRIEGGLSPWERIVLEAGLDTLRPGHDDEDDAHEMEAAWEAGETPY